jgi:hypothetical protein
MSLEAWAAQAFLNGELASGKFPCIVRLAVRACSTRKTKGAFPAPAEHFRMEEHEIGTLSDRFCLIQPVVSGRVL